MALPPLRTQVTADTRGFVGGMNRAVTALGGFKGGLGAAAGALAVFQGVKGLAGATRAFAEFDEAMTESQAIMGDLSEGTMARMQQAALDVSRTTVKSAEEAAESYFFLASAGLDAEQSVAALPQVAAFAQAGMFDMATATDLATDAQSALGLASEDATQNLRNMRRVTDVLVRSNQLANASVEQFADAITNKLGARLRLLNKDVEEGAAALAALADAGIKGRRAGTGLNIVYRDLVATAAENEEGFRRLGIRVFDTEGNMRNLADVVADFEEVLGDATDQEKAAAFETLGLNRRAQDFLAVLIGVSDEMREYERNVREAGGATQEVAEKQIQTLNHQMGLLGDEVQAAKIQLGGLIAPGLSKDVQAVRIVLSRLREEAETLSDLAGEGEDGDRPSLVDRILAVAPGTIASLARAREAWVALRTAIIGASDEAEAGEAVPFPQGPPAPEEGEDGETAREREERRIAERRDKMARALTEGRNRLLEEELGLHSLALDREEQRLQKLIEEGAAWREIVAQAERVAEIEDRLSEPPEISPVGRDRFGEGGAIRRDPSVPSLPERRAAAREAQGADDAAETMDRLGDGALLASDAMRDALLPALDELAGKAIQGQGALQSLADAILTALGSHLQGQGGTTGFLGEAVSAFAGGFQHGGRIPAGKFGIVGEAGPEMVSGPANVRPIARGGDRVQFNFQLDIRALDSRDVNQAIEQQGAQGVVNALMRAASQSEAVSRALIQGSG